MSATGLRRILTRQDGLSLVEVLMGVVILATSITPVAFLLTGDLQGVAIREETTRALYLAQGKMEELLALDYDDLKQGPSFSGWAEGPDSVYLDVVVGLNPSGSFDPNMKQISITTGSVTLHTYRTNAFEP